MVHGILGQVWYLLVSIPDLCILTYFNNGGIFMYNVNNNVTIISSYLFNKERAPQQTNIQRDYKRFNLILIQV